MARNFKSKPETNKEKMARNFKSKPETNKEKMARNFKSKPETNKEKMARNFKSKPEVNKGNMARNSKFNGNKKVRARNSNIQNRNFETYQEQKSFEKASENKIENESEQVETFEINLAGNPNSCLIKIAHMKVRSLIDSGASVSLLHNKIYNSIKGLPKLEKKKVNLQGVNGASLNVLGSINLDFNMKGNKMNHTFYVVSDMNRNAILGRDWLVKFGVRVYFDLGCLRINKTYVPLVEDIHIASIVRLAQTTVFKPQTSNICYVKGNKNYTFSSSKSFEISPITKGHLSYQPGLMVANSVANINEKRQMPKGIAIGRASPVLEENVVSLESTQEHSEIENVFETDLNVPDVHRGRVLQLLNNNRDVFAFKDTELGQTDTVKMRIDTGDNPPVKLKPYRTPLHKREIVNKAITDMLEANIIRRSNSNYSSPVVLVDKKDKTTRFCIDFRSLNSSTLAIRYPLPVIDDILTLLGAAKFYSLIDLRAGFWQIKMAEEDKSKTAFVCHKGLFEFNVMPFGLQNSPAVFSQLMEIVLQDLNFAISYIDDILIFSETLEEHFNHIQQVFDRLRQHNLKLKLKKCQFLQEETNYLGFKINIDGVKPDDAKVEAIKTLPNPVTVKEKRKTIYFLSHKLSDTQSRWSTIEKEAFSIHYALQKLDHYLHGAEFIIRTDHKPLKYLLLSPQCNKKLQLWALGIASYNCKIEWLAGTDNTIADYLSRRPPGQEGNQNQSETIEVDISDKAFQINTLNSNEFNPKDFASCDYKEDDQLSVKECTIPGYDMKIEQSLDIELSEIINQINTGKASRSVDNKHIIINDILYYISYPDDDLKLRLYVPLQLRNEAKIFWPKLYKELNSYINSCVICQSQSAGKTKPLLQISDIPPFPFAKIGVDLSGPYPTSLSGNKYIVSFVCHYSGWPLAFPVPNKTSENVVHLLIEEIIPNFSVPLVIVSDNGGEFTSKIFEETLKELNISHITTSFYHPQGNAKVERFHRTLHDVMAKKLQSDASTWDVCLNQTIAAIRFQKNESTKFSPFFLLYNRDPVLPIDNLLKPRRKYVGEDPHKILLEQQHKSFILVHRNLKKSKEKQKQNADKNRQEINLEIGDPVYFKNHLRKSKLDTKWKPYYRIIEKNFSETFRSPSEVGNINIKPSIIVGWIITSKVISDIEENSYITALVEFGTSIISEFSYCRQHPDYKEHMEDTQAILALPIEFIEGTHALPNEIIKMILSGLQEYDKLQHRTKRSVLPFVGRIMSFLFGTVSDEDLRTINSNIRVLANNQKRISHVLSESLTIVNVTRAEVAQNRKTINSLTTGLHDVDLKLRNITTLLKKK
ncbi:Retrovirus-related Pol polyprotein from transposon 297 [Mytilus edulis]|uniref:RNA-directed DNA polymerase n=1 Tax=Mytilus edulis TaxID=6550 RepID=A0A8S3S0T2_MYTED|nr:Retrovirus-related Pol polyprotein from transposon 297 [Mytilus edulis]